MNNSAEAKKVVEFGRYSGKIEHFINNDPACIMGFKDTAVPYSSYLAAILSISRDVIPGIVDVVKGKVRGFYEDMVKGRKVVVVTDTPYDRGKLYAEVIARRYKKLEEKYNMKGMIFVTTSPFKIHSIDEIMVTPRMALT